MRAPILKFLIGIWFPCAPSNPLDCLTHDFQQEEIGPIWNLPKYEFCYHFLEPMWARSRWWESKSRRDSRLESLFLLFEYCQDFLIEEIWSISKEKLSSTKLFHLWSVSREFLLLMLCLILNYLKFLSLLVLVRREQLSTLSNDTYLDWFFLPTRGISSATCQSKNGYSRGWKGRKIKRFLKRRRFTLW